METLQTFHGVLDRGFTGNMSFQFHIPHGIHELSVILTYEKERIQDPASYIERFRHPLIRQAVPYLGRIPTDRQLQEMVQAMKTEIQLCAMIGGVFAGNVHMPGTRKEILLKEGVPFDGRIGLVMIIVIVYQVVVEITPWNLEIKGGPGHVETDRTA